MGPELLLAMQAAGMITDFFGTMQQANLARMGNRINQAGIEANIEMTRLETEDQSLQAMQQLRQNLGTQIAMNAARGTRTGAGSALVGFNTSIGNFNADERVRRINLLAKVNQLRGGGVISALQTKGDVSKMWQGFAQRTINNFPSGGFGSSNSGGRKQGFGLTSFGG